MNTWRTKRRYTLGMSSIARIRRGHHLQRGVRRERRGLVAQPVRGLLASATGTRPRTHTHS